MILVIGVDELQHLHCRRPIIRHIRGREAAKAAKWSVAHGTHVQEGSRRLA